MIRELYASKHLRGPHEKDSTVASTKNLHAEMLPRKLSPEMYQVLQFPFSAKSVYNLSSDRYKDLKL